MNKEQEKTTHDQSYLKAYEDIQLLKKDIMRPVRMELETLKPELYLKQHKIEETIVCFGSARVQETPAAEKRVAEAKKVLEANPNDQNLKNRLYEAEGLLKLSKYYDEGRKFANLVVEKAGNRFAVVTGGGPGLMEADCTAALSHSMAGRPLRCS